ncbi:unnamed protein product [Adineta steineri]|uniref:Uncharacterized protein n=1 Tax=Adineta steineri TaxID=433720 RepID=A0A818ZZR8_9BILA|nr:unnamed protein product [Adineta steineri]CAF3777358.1 unnamed protein product [Adineta steineri]
MHRILIVLSYVVFISYINGASFKSRTSIHRDAIEFANLAETFWASKPDEFNKIESFIHCKVLETCCEEKQRKEAIPLVISELPDDKNRFLEIVGSCINSTEQNGGDKWCRTYSQEIISPRVLWSNFQVRYFLQLMMEFLIKLGEIGAGREKVCDDEEMYAIRCLSNKKLIQRCVSKGLRDLMKRFDRKPYKNLVMETKQALSNINQKWSEISIKNGKTN